MMNLSTALLIGAAVLLSPAAVRAAETPAIIGDYVEIRSCDVYTGPCFANAETGITGEEAILTWTIRQGRWDDVRLDGLSVIGVVRAAATLGDSHHDPYPARAVLIVDDQAGPEQRWALVSFAKEMGRELLENVVEVQVAPIEATVGTCSKSGCASVSAGDVVKIKTRCLGGEDHVCGNETAFYPPLTRVDNAVPAFTVDGSFSGKGLGITWNDAGRRSAYLATFRR